MNRLKSIIFLIALAGIAACTEIFEEDISEQGVTLLAPGDSSVVRSQEVLFWWEPLEYATGYRLQVVRPNFDAAEALVIDSLVEGNKLSVTLEGGAYEWRLRGENSAYETGYERRIFRVDTATDISLSQVAVLSPVQDHHTKDKVLQFAWEDVSGADYYLLEFLSPNFGDTTLRVTEFTQNFEPMEEEYQWRVSAVNGSGKSSSAVHRFKIDTVPPQAPVLLSPQDNAQLTVLPVKLEWERDDTEQIQADTVLVYEIQSDGVSQQFVLYGEYVQQETLLSLESLPDGQFQWMVKSVDKAGNEGRLSSVRNFELKRN